MVCGAVAQSGRKASSMNVDRFNPVLVLHFASASAIVRKRFHSLTTYRTTLNLKSRRADDKGPNNTSLCSDEPHVA